MKRCRIGKRLLLVLIMISMVTVLGIPVCATQSRSENFNKGYSLSGNGAEDICRVALAQYLKTGSNLGYSEAWCADFVADCAKLAGQASAIPANGTVNGLANNIKNAGGGVVSSPQKGDIAIISWNSGSSYAHAEIVYDVKGSLVYTIGGNSGRNTSSCYVSEVWKHTWPQSYGHVVCYLRPNYRSQLFFDFWGFDDTHVSGQTKIWWKQIGYGTCDVNLSMDGKALGTIYPDSGGFFSYILDTTKYSNGKHTFSAIIRSTSGAEKTVQRTISIWNDVSPRGNFDGAEGGQGSVAIWGWAFDEDAPASSIDVRIYIGGEVGYGAPCYTVKANTYRPDVEKAYPGMGNYHGFSSTVNVSETGIQTIYAYAVNFGSGGTSLCFIGSQTVTIEKKCSHTYTTVISKAATCTAEGSQYKKCSKCGRKTETAVIPKINHHYVVAAAKAATCGTAGSQYERCSVCGAVKSGSQKTIQATGKHSYGDWAVTKESTVTSAGSKQRTCRICGKKETVSTAKKKAIVRLNITGTLPLKVKKTVTAKVTKMTSGDQIESWESSNRKVAAVDAKGKITGKKAGIAEITVTMKSGVKSSFKVRVQNSNVKTSGMKLGIEKKIILRKGKSLAIKAARYPITSTEKITYHSSNKKVATVTSKGVIKAKKAGRTTITVKSGRKSIKVTVTVK